MAMNAAGTINSSSCATVRAAQPNASASSAPTVQPKPWRSGERRELGGAGTPTAAGR